MTGEFLARLGYALLATLLLETLAVLLLKRSSAWLLPCWLGNVLTNPLLNAVFSLIFFRLSLPVSILCLLLMEAGAVFYEAYVYDGLLSCGRKEALRVSLACNAVSFLTGVAADIVRLGADKAMNAWNGWQPAAGSAAKA